jgi:bifunctional non-homologous end joining protein LigD
LLAEVQYSALTAEQRLRAPIFKGNRDDLSAPRVGPKRKPKINKSTSAVPKENILQLLPDAVAPTKDQLARYWRAVATEALPYIARRPLKLVRHDLGTTYYHKGSLPPVAKGVHQLRIQKREGGAGTRLWVDDLSGLLGLVDMGAVELHTWNSTVDNLEHPDLMVFYLDPGPGIGTSFVVEIALGLRDLLIDEGLESWPKLTGGKGVHIMVPIGPRKMSHDEAHRYSRTLADRIAATQPDRLTTSAALSARDRRLFIDYLRNGRGTTAVATFSTRARRGFPIAAPATWEALELGIRPDAYALTRLWSTPPMQTVRASRKRASQHTDASRLSPPQDAKHERRRRRSKRLPQQTG